MPGPKAQDSPSPRGWRGRVKRLEQDLAAIARATRDPRTPWAARFLAGFIIAYALSPIDLIPDVIPVLGLLDELVLLPLGLLLVIRLIPPEVLAEHRAASHGDERLPKSRAAALVIVALWIAVAMGIAAWLTRSLF